MLLVNVVSSEVVAPFCDLMRLALVPNPKRQSLVVFHLVEPSCLHEIINRNFAYAVLLNCEVMIIVTQEGGGGKVMASAVL